MLAIPTAILIVVLSLFFADERKANEVAHELCPDTHVSEVEGRYRFACDGREYVVACEDGDCAALPLQESASARP